MKYGIEINEFYKILLCREASSEEIAYWNARIDSGLTLQGIQDEIINSFEHKVLLSTLLNKVASLEAEISKYNEIRSSISNSINNIIESFPVVMRDIDQRLRNIENK